MTDLIYCARSLGKVPDRYWYQLNGQSAQQNFQAQRGAIYERLTEPFADEDELTIIFESGGSYR